MSVNAYRINKIVKEESPSFNLWRDEKMVEELAVGGYLDSMDSSGGGIIELPLCALEELLKDYGDGMKKDTKQALIQDITWMLENKKEYIKYYCY